MFWVNYCSVLNGGMFVWKIPSTDTNASCCVCSDGMQYHWKLFCTYHFIAGQSWDFCLEMAGNIITILVRLQVAYEL